MDKKLVTKQHPRQFINENNMSSVQDVQDMLKDLFAETLQEKLEAELDDSLGNAKHDVQNKRTTNSRNGKTRKRVTSEFGEMEITVPREREGEFEPQVVKKHQSKTSDTPLLRYLSGVS
ncbi:hypothetical protein CBW65_01460 [Tumebacillus avium]|uniref:Mutator family transposase n=1 Tax=Tumebacillus avium TaxID=1903704 RepID=A0A1Y0IHV2_9BACL|nr:hypothetical protein CBW65_01460 [Tumebacillus avium]